MCEIKLFYYWLYKLQLNYVTQGLYSAFMFLVIATDGL
jgi:hypothetical protein